MEKEGIQTKEIRHREIGHRQGKNKTGIKAVMDVTKYDASSGKEFFISFEDRSLNAILGFCRLRFPSQCLRSEITKETAIVRELHVYGTAAGLGEKGIFQHRGLGKRLLEKAEKISKEHGKNKILVISGVGVREYYRKLGYVREGDYMKKCINRG